MQAPRGSLMPMKMFLGDVVKLNRTHGCGENRWEVIRVGMDIRIRCLGCGRSLLIPRPEFEKQVLGFIDPPGLAQIKHNRLGPKREIG